ncbi:MAG: DUF4157 domain-containing protein, partial [Bacteroidota bacterium]
MGSVLSSEVQDKRHAPSAQEQTLGGGLQELAPAESSEQQSPSSGQQALARSGTPDFRMDSHHVDSIQMQPDEAEEEEMVEMSPQIQKEAIAAAASPEDDESSTDDPFVQSKCAECEKEEHLQQQVEAPNLQTSLASGLGTQSRADAEIAQMNDPLVQTKSKPYEEEEGQEQEGTTINPKLKVGQPGDKYEVEADQVADQVVQRLAKPHLVQRQQLEEEEEIQGPESGEVSVVQEKPIPVIQRTASKFPEPQEPAPEQAGDATPIEVHRRESAEEEELDPPEVNQKALQRSASDGQDPASDIEGPLRSSKGGGNPLGDGVRSQMEQSIGADFSGVRVHTDQRSVGMNQQLNARAFTNEQDIYFNSGEYKPETKAGQHLLAHELTHTIHQGASNRVDPKTKESTDATLDIQKAPRKYKDFDEVTKDHPLGVGSISKTGSSKEIHIKNLVLKSYASKRKSITLPTPHKLEGGERRSNQGAIWKGQALSIAKSALEQLTTGLDTSEELALYLKKGSNSQAPTIIGTIDQFAEKLVVPFWDKTGRTTLHQIEHKVDYQIAGKLADDPKNLLLIDQASNSSLGSKVKQEINSKLSTIIDHYHKNGIAPNQLVHSPEAAKSNANYSIYIDFFNSEQQTPTRSSIHADTESFREVINENLVDITESTVPKGFFKLKVTTGTSGGVTHVLSYTSNPQFLQVEVDNPQADEPDLKSVKVLRWINDGKGNFQAVEGKLPEMTPTKLGKHSYEVVVQPSHISAIEQKLKMKNLSPTKGLSNVSFDPNNGLSASGKIDLSFPLFDQSEIDISIVNSEYVVTGVLSTSALEDKVPKPFKISHAGIEISASSSEGLQVGGSIGFGIDNMGDGEVTVKVKPGGDGLEIGGKFSFDQTKIFSKAEVGVTYSADHGWEVTGELGIDEGKIKGVTEGNLVVSYAEDTLSGIGKIALDVPGVKAGEFSFQYSGGEDYKFEVGVTLADDIPGVKGGTINASISNGEDGPSLGIGGSVNFAVPGLENATLTVQYQVEIITMEAEPEFRKSVFHGKFKVGVSNQKVGEDGKPIPGKADSLMIYGYGELTVDLTDTIKGKVGVRLTQDQKILLSGAITLTNQELGKGYSIPDKTLFSFQLTPVPLFTIGVAQVLLTADVSIKAFAGIKPITLNGSVGFEDYDLALVGSEAPGLTITASAEAAAEAGLKLGGKLGIAGSVAIIYVEGGVGIDLGLKATAKAKIGGKATWSPADGFELKKAEAELGLDIVPTVSASLIASAGIYYYIGQKELWRETYPLAASQFPPLARLKATFPIGYENGQIIQSGSGDFKMKDNPLENSEDASSYLKSGILGTEHKPKEKKVSEFSEVFGSILSELPSIGPSNPEYQVNRGRQFFIKEVAEYFGAEEAAFLEGQLSSLESAEFFSLRDRLLFSEETDAEKDYEISRFAMDHTTVSAADIANLREELGLAGGDDVMAKLKVGAPDDDYEVEADQVADQVVQRLSSNDQVQRQEREDGEEEGKEVQEQLNGDQAVVQEKSFSGLQRVESKLADLPDVMKRGSSNESQAQGEPKKYTSQGEYSKIDLPVIEPPEEKKEQPPEVSKSSIQGKSSDGTSHSSDVEGTLRSSKGGGDRMNPEVQSQMEESFGTDFSGVRVHTDQRSVGMNQQLNARAFTNQKDIYFNSGEYNPETKEGQHLLAHELTHTIHQGADSDSVQAFPIPPKTTSKEPMPANPGDGGPVESR